MQHVYIEGVALNPFSAVEQPSQILTARSIWSLLPDKNEEKPSTEAYRILQTPFKCALEELVDELTWALDASVG
jgi:hypothetical protein